MNQVINGHKFAWNIAVWHSLYEEVDGTRIHYERVGSGDQVLLLIPGAIGCTRSDFVDQIDGGLNRKLFTIISIDLPGYGKSRPPERIYSLDTYPNDARKASGLMDKLGFKLYSILGWSDGAKVAMLVAVQNPARVEKLVIWAVAPYFTDYDYKAVSLFRDVDLMSGRSRQSYVEAYGPELFERLWHNHADFLFAFASYSPPMWDIRKKLRCIRCPTLILHGDKDPLIDKNHPVVVEREIPDSRLVRFTNGSHDIHQVFVEEFNRTVTNFLLE